MTPAVRRLHDETFANARFVLVYVREAHANDEWVGVERLVDATAAYAELYASFG